MRLTSAMLLRLLERLKVVDIILFAAIMLWKLFLFNKLLSVQYMDMTSTDAVIELGALLLVCSWTLLLPVIARIWALIGMGAGLTLLLYADVIYYRYFQDLLSIPVLQQLGQAASLGDSITTLVKAGDWLLFVDFPLLALLAAYLLRNRRSISSAFPAAGHSHTKLRRRRSFLLRFGLSAAVFTIGFNLFFVNVNHAANTWAKGLFEKNWWNLSIYNVAGGLGYHGYDLYRYAKLNWLESETASIELRAETGVRMAERSGARSELEDDALFSAYKGNNVMLVQVESLQSFVIDQSIGGKEITPRLNRLIRESAYFPHFYHQTAQGRTSDADFAANCSLLPAKNGSVFIQYANRRFHCLPEQLKDNGYSAAVFHPYQAGFWNRNAMYSGMKYDRFFSLKHYELDEQVGWALGDKSFYRQTLDRIAAMPQPFHAFLITLSSHHPYRMPAAERQLPLEELEGTMLGDYLQAIHYADAALGELIDRLKSEGLWDNTIFALYGDHDNSIQEWPLYGRFADAAKGGLEGNALRQEQLTRHVPFLVHLPDNSRAGAYDAAGGQLDIAPTLLHLLGIPTGRLYMLGAPLLTDRPAPDSQRDSRLIVQRNGSWTDGSRYYIAPADGLSMEGQCYETESGTLLHSSACESDTQRALQELRDSDTIIQHDFIRLLDEDGALEAIQR